MVTRSARQATHTKRQLFHCVLRAYVMPHDERRSFKFIVGMCGVVVVIICVRFSRVHIFLFVYIRIVCVVYMYTGIKAEKWQLNIGSIFSNEHAVLLFPPVWYTHTQKHVAYTPHWRMNYVLDLRASNKVFFFVPSRPKRRALQLEFFFLPF